MKGRRLADDLKVSRFAFVGDMGVENNGEGISNMDVA